jgi:hypothetical protein
MRSRERRRGVGNEIGVSRSEVQGEKPWGASPQACDYMKELVMGLPQACGLKKKLVARLRKQLQAGNSSTRHLVTEPGVGYRFVTDGIPLN